MSRLSTMWKSLQLSTPSNKTRNYLIFILLAVLTWMVIWYWPAKTRPEVFEIARDSTWQPLNLIGKEKNMTAFSDDLLLEIAKIENIRVSILDTTYGIMFDGLWRNEYVGVLSPLIPNANNRQDYDFSNTYYHLGPVLIVPEWSSAESLKQLDNKIIGIPTGSSLAFELEQNPTILVTPFDNMLTALDSLSNGKIDGVIMDAVRAYAYTNGFYKGRLKVATAPLTKDGLRLVTLKSENGSRLIEHFNNGLKKLKDSGSYKELLQKWDLIDIQP